MELQTSWLRLLCLAVLITLTLQQVISSRRVIGGEAAVPGQFPYMAFLICSVAKCSASIVTEHWVLSAAHCIIDPEHQYQVFAGTVAPNNDHLNAQTRVVAHVIVHPEYTQDPLGQFSIYDVSLLHVEEAFVWTPYVQPIQLADNFKKQQPRECIGVGFGLTALENESAPSDDLHYLIINSEVLPCKEVLVGDMIMDHQLCSTGGGWGIQHLYKGDSGGPLVCAGLQYGITSMVSLIHPDGLQIHTSVPHFYQWIKHHVVGISS